MIQNFITKHIKDTILLDDTLANKNTLPKSSQGES